MADGKEREIKISVILPVYNEELYLKQCLDSICGQSLRDIEIICVDDGSTDSSLDIIRVYEQQDARIKVLMQENQYAGVARNHGMKEAKGKYLLFLDSDDFFELDMFEKLYERAEEDCLDIAFCRYHFYDDCNKREMAVDFKKKDSFIPEGKRVFSGVELKDAGIFQIAVGWPWDKLFRREFVQKCGYFFPDFRSSEDGFFVYMLMARAQRMGMVSENLVFHRRNNLNSLSNTKEADWENGFKMLELIADELDYQGLYCLFGKSFASMSVEFQVWYLQSMYEKKAFYSCFYYVKEKMEPRFGFAELQEGFLGEKKVLQRYLQMLESEPEELLFAMLREKENALIRAQGKGWVFPYCLIPKSCRLIIYGAGAAGKDYYKQLIKTGYCREVHIVDKNYMQQRGKDLYVENPDIIDSIEFDYIIISIQDKATQRDVKRWLLSEGVEEKKIVFA